MTAAADKCDPISTDAKLSDVQINSVAPRRPKIFKLVSPGEGGEPKATVYMRSSLDYNDAAGAMGLLTVEWNLWSP